MMQRAHAMNALSIELALNVKADDSCCLRSIDLMMQCTGCFSMYSFERLVEICVVVRVCASVQLLASAWM